MAIRNTDALAIARTLESTPIHRDADAKSTAKTRDMSDVAVPAGAPVRGIGGTYYIVRADDAKSVAHYNGETTLRVDSADVLALFASGTVKPDTAPQRTPAAVDVVQTIGAFCDVLEATYGATAARSIVSAVVAAVGPNGVSGTGVSGTGRGPLFAGKPAAERAARDYTPGARRRRIIAKLALRCYNGLQSFTTRSKRGAVSVKGRYSTPVERPAERRTAARRR